MEQLNYAKEIATTILAQLGGNKFITMTGAKLSYCTNHKKQPVLNCALPSNVSIKNRINLVAITYNIGLDLYELTFSNTRLKNSKVIKQINEVYADDLISYFEQETGLYCYL